MKTNRQHTSSSNGGNAGYLAKLRALAPFSDTPPVLLERVLAAAQLREVAAGGYLIRGDEDRHDYLALIAGEIELCRAYLTPDRTEEIHVARLVGDASKILPVHALPRHTSVRAITTARVLHIPGGRMEELLAWSQRYRTELRKESLLHARMSLVSRAGPFKYLPLEHVKRALEALVPVDVAGGTAVVQQGERGDCYYLIESGSAQVWRRDDASEEPVPVATLGPGDAFGEEALLIDGFRNATVRMVTSGRLWALAKADFDTLIKAPFVPEVDAARARDMVARGEVRWLDCRYECEFEEAHIPHALHLPLDSLRERLASLSRDVGYVVYCRSGRRSVCAAYLLRERGYRTYSLVGGISDWPYALVTQ